jgi:hypothetical protein
MMCVNRALDFAIVSDSFHCIEVLSQPAVKARAPWSLAESMQGQKFQTVRDRLEAAENMAEASSAHSLNPRLVHSSLDSPMPVSWDSQAWNSASTNNTASASELSMAMTKKEIASPANTSPVQSPASSGDDRRETGTKWHEALQGFRQAVISGSRCDVTGIDIPGGKQVRTQEMIDLPVSPGQSMSSFLGSAPSTPQTPLNLEIAAKHSLFRNSSFYAVTNGSPQTPSSISCAPTYGGRADHLNVDPVSFDLPHQDRTWGSGLPTRRRHDFVIDC